jgi:hypothetical protein
LVDRHLVESNTVHLVRHAHRDFRKSREDIKFREDEIGNSVDAGGISGDGRVVPSAAARATRRGAAFGTGLSKPLALVVVGGIGLVPIFILVVFPVMIDLFGRPRHLREEAEDNALLGEQA